MKKTFMMLVVLFVIYLGLQIVTKIFSSGHFLEYNLTVDGKVFTIKETFINSKSQSNYFFEVKTGEDMYYFQTYSDFSKADKIIKDIKYVEVSGYKCLLPIFFGNKAKLDILCLDGEKINDYANIATKNKELDNWVNGLGSVYNTSLFKDDLTNTQANKNAIIYPANVLPKHYLSIENYRGVNTISIANINKLADVPIFEKDQYTRIIAGYGSKYYITADYSFPDSLKKFLVVDIMENIQHTIETTKDISYDSYIMGSVDDSFYLFDKKNDKQYQINVKTKKVIEVGNKEVGLKIFYNNKWEWKPLSEVKHNLLFSSSYVVTPENARIDEVMGEDGYKYYYVKTSTGYDAYLSLNRAPNFKKYIFSLDNLESIVYENDYVYYKSVDTIYYYHNSKGVRAVYQNPELKFNPNIKFGIYISKWCCQTSFILYLFSI